LRDECAAVKGLVFCFKFFRMAVVGLSKWCIVHMFLPCMTMSPKGVSPLYCSKQLRGSVVNLVPSAWAKWVQLYSNKVASRSSHSRSDCFSPLSFVTVTNAKLPGAFSFVC